MTGIHSIIHSSSLNADSGQSPPPVLVAHAGKQHAYRHALALQRLGCLSRFVTSSYYKPQSVPDRFMSRWRWMDARLRRRHIGELDEASVSRRWSLELPELLARGVFGPGKIADSLVYRRDRVFDEWVAQELLRRWGKRIGMYWGFQGSCLESLRAARSLEKQTAAEFATAHVTSAIALLSREAELHPEWADSISNFHFPDWYRERLEQEPLEAEYCIAASSFTKQSLLQAGVSPEKIKVLPLGADLERFTERPRSTKGAFRILFVGGVGQRKGIKYLLDAYRRVRSPNTELVIVGPLSGSGRAFKKSLSNVVYHGRQDQAEVIEHMSQCHVLVLPSVFEGFGLVIAEAMATGMPVIASTHSAGPDIIREGTDGFVLDPDDVEGLANKLDWLASHRRSATEMGREAALRALDFSWPAHQGRLWKLLLEMTASASCQC